MICVPVIDPLFIEKKKSQVCKKALVIFFFF